MTTSTEYETHSYTYSLVTQGDVKFYSLTIPSEVLAATCFVTNRFEDKIEGFQRRLDEKRAQEIADYIDSGIGSIPNAIILSAQPEAEFTLKKGGRALSFKADPKAFLVLDGQHRVWGFALSKKTLRVPVIVYQGLSRKEETRLFIDINTKQKPVPSELLLDIKQLAETETSDEQVFRTLFNYFSEHENSALRGLLSASERKNGKISRTTFNQAFKNVNTILGNQSELNIFYIFNNYLHAIKSILKDEDNSLITTPSVFKALISFFSDVAPRVKFKYEGDYSTENFISVLAPLSSINQSQITKHKRTYTKIVDILNQSLSKNFSL